MVGTNTKGGDPLTEILSQFRFHGKPVSHERYGNGHINITYLVVDDTDRKYILQSINNNVFRAPEVLMKNMVAVTTHLRHKNQQEREVLSLIPTVSGAYWYVDATQQFWRAFPFITDTISLDLVETPADFRESAIAFGTFQKYLADFPAHTLAETIPHFHDTPKRYEALQQAIDADVCGRAQQVANEIAFALSQRAYASTLVDLQKEGQLPLRVTHNDTKLNNVLFDRATRKALCVVDLDTVMPGLSANDFGDSIRFGATTAAEDEQDLDKVNFSLPLYEAYVEGFLSVCGDSLTDCEIAHLRDGAKMMTLECGVRFLTDYLSGDTYFHIHREGHNLDRCRTQFKLVAQMDTLWATMQQIIDDCMAQRKTGRAST